MSVNRESDQTLETVRTSGSDSLQPLGQVPEVGEQIEHTWGQVFPALEAS